MPEYSYEGRDAQGQAVLGRRTAESSDAVANQLFNESITPIKIKESIAQISWQQSVKFGLRQGVKTSDLVMFCRQMYTLTKAGITINISAKRLAETTASKTMADALNGIVHAVEAGTELATAMQRYPNVFSPLVISIIHVGENSGRLDEAFMQISDYLELEVETMKRFKAAIRYPIIVLIAITAAMVIINVFVIPTFAGIFANMGAELPLMTRILLATSNFMLSYWQSLLGVTVAGFFGLRIYLSTHMGKLTWHRLQLRLPLMGNIFNRILLARFARTFSMVIRTGIPMNEGIGLVARAMGNRYTEEKVMSIRAAISRGEGLSVSAANTGMFSPLVLQMLVVGEETGKLDTMLDEVAEFYEREVDYDIKKLGEAIEPILLLFVGAMVLVLALGVFLPMWNMVDMAQPK